MTHQLWIWLATMGVGKLPMAPGTWGTMLTVAILAVLPDPGAIGMLVGAVALTVVAVPISTRAESALGKKDPGSIVIDEAAGMALALVALPRTGTAWLLAFIAFRAFDIMKPPPANRAQHLPGGLGIVADDAIAGVYANLVVQLLLRLI